jgi:hypothetical protein
MKHYGKGIMDKLFRCLLIENIFYIRTKFLGFIVN